MAGTYFSFDNFKSLVHHQVGILSRFDKEQEVKFSILFFPLKDMSVNHVTQALSKALRSSDAVFAHEDGYYLLLPHTDTEGALHIVNSLKEYFGEEINEVIITYPDDGTESELLLKRLKEYANDWCKAELEFPEPRR